MDIIYFLGRLHVLALHLPVGIIAVVVVLEFLGRFQRFKSLLVSANFLWLAATIASFVTVALGMMHRAEGGFEGASMESHAFWGIATALCSLGVLLFRFFGEKAYQKVQVLLGLWMLVTITMTGHYGGNLTHGSTYLLVYAPSPIQNLAGYHPREAVSDIAQADIFLDVVKPMLDLRCSSCHNDDKQRGELSLASYESMLLGGKSGSALIAGNSEESTIVQRIMLPQSHEDFMPADSKTPLTEEQTNLVAWWIDAGAPQQALLTTLDPSEEMLGTASDFLGLNPQAIIPTVIAASDSDLTNARSLGFLIRQLSQESNFIEMDISVRGGELSQAHIDAVNALSPRIITLSLKNTDLNDEQFSSIADIPSLLQLNLALTDITDASFEQIERYSNLDVLNIYGNSNMSQNGLSAFEADTNIDRIYSWGID